MNGEKIMNNKLGMIYQTNYIIVELMYLKVSVAMQLFPKIIFYSFLKIHIKVLLLCYNNYVNINYNKNALCYAQLSC